MRQDNGVGQTVGNPITSAQTVRDGMNVSNVGARKGNTRFIRCRKHIAARPYVVPTLISIEQIVVDEQHRLTRHLARIGRGTAPDKGLDSMR